MNKESPKVTPIQAVVADCYRTFRRYQAPTHPLDACTLCCMPQELEQEMRQLPLVKLTTKHFYEYNNAAKSEVQPADELLYLLPRMLELMAEGAEIHHSIELTLQRVGHCPAGSFSEAAMDVLNRFALAYFQCALSGERQLSGGRRWLEDPLSILLMFHIGGLATGPLLDLWLQMDHPESAIQFVEATYWGYWEKQDCANAFADDRPAFKQQLKQWMSDPMNRQRFVEKLMAPGFRQLAELRRPTGNTAFGTMVDAVFDQLTQ